MLKRAAEIFNNKVSLIYEYNKKSPLFVRKASAYVDAGNPAKAIEILSEGLQIYPNYPAAHFVLGKAYTAEGNYSQALKSYKTGCELIHSPRTYNHYLKEIEALQKQKSLFQYGIERSFNSEEESHADEPDLFGQMKVEEEPPVKKEKPIEERPYQDIESRLEEIAKGLSSVKLNEVTPSEETEKKYSETFPDDNMIVSETLAKIYTAQGEFAEAIKVYRKLMQKNPSKQDYYTEKINELRNQLG